MTQCLLVLPLQLESFAGRPTEHGNVLDWQLTPTPELQSFVIERSTDGVNFLPVAQQAVLPDTTHYRFTDGLLPSPGATLYYRIKMVKFDGTAGYSNIVALQTTSNSGTLTTSLTPNPARTSTTLVIRSLSSGPARILFLNTAGTPLYSRSVMVSAGTNTIDLPIPPQLPPGIYIVRTTTGSESSVSRLIAY
jgi:hypothetical protein